MLSNRRNDSIRDEEEEMTRENCSGAPNIRRGLLPATVAAVTMAVSGCSFFGFGGPDVSAEGQVAYACELAANAHENYDFTDMEEYIGENADPGISEAAAAASLVGAVSGYALPEHLELSEAGADIFRGINTVDLEMIETAVGDMAVHCEDASSVSPDISADGQAAYSCALAGHVREEHGPSETWGGIGEEPAWHQAGAVAALFGGANASSLVGHEEHAEDSQELILGVSQLNPERIDESLESIVEACDD